MQIAAELEATCEDLWFKFMDVILSLMALFSVGWMISIKLFQVVVNVGNLPVCSGITVVQSWPKSHRFTVIVQFEFAMSAE